MDLNLLTHTNKVYYPIAKISNLIIIIIVDKEQNKKEEEGGKKKENRAKAKVYNGTKNRTKETSEKMEIL